MLSVGDRKMWKRRGSPDNKRHLVSVTDMSGAPSEWAQKFWISLVKYSCVLTRKCIKAVPSVVYFMLHPLQIYLMTQPCLISSCEYVNVHTDPPQHSCDILLREAPGPDAPKHTCSSSPLPILKAHLDDTGPPAVAWRTTKKTAQE